MKNFNVFQHPTLGYEAVKVGFSWPGFVADFFGFGWVWALCKRMWLVAILLAVATVITLVMFDSDNDVIVALSWIVGIGITILVGFFGNQWRVSVLTKRGYQHLKVVLAANPDAAAAQVAAAK